MYPANIYLFKVSNKNTRKTCEICSKLTIKTPYTAVFIITLNIFHIFFNVSIVTLNKQILAGKLN